MSSPRDPDQLLTLVCITCGAERFFLSPPKDAVVCPRCAGTVFRPFITPSPRNEAIVLQLESTARSIELDAASPAVSPDDLRDLNNP